MRVRLSVWLVAVTIASIGMVAALPGKASAEKSGYPFGGKPCVHAPYAVQNTHVNWCPNYDWGDRPNDTSRANVISPYGYYYRNCTDYAAWKVASLGVGPAQYRGLGDAKQWAAPPAKNGLRVDSTPAVGAVAVRTSGVYGHVAFVEAIEPSGAITVSEYNKHADGNFGVRSGMPVSLGFTHFVHFEAYMSVPVAVPIPEPLPPAPLVPAIIVPDEPVSEVQRIPEVPADKVVAPVQDAAEVAPLERSAAKEEAAPPSKELVTEPVTRTSNPEVVARVLPQLGSFARVTGGDDQSDQGQLASQPLDVLPEPSPAQTAYEPTEEPDEETVPAETALLDMRITGAQAVLEQPIATTLLPVPHQWWRPPLASPPSKMVADDQLTKVFAQSYVSPLGYWALGGLMIATVLREYYPVLRIRYDWGR